MTFNYYLEQPYNEGSSPEERKEIQEKIKALKKAGKDLPVDLLNPNDTSIYLFIRIVKQTIKMKSGQQILSRHWNTKADKNGNHVKRSYNGCVEFNGLLDTFKKNVHRIYNQMTEANQNVSVQEIREAIEEFKLKKEPASASGFFDHYQSGIATVHWRIFLGHHSFL